MQILRHNKKNTNYRTIISVSWSSYGFTREFFSDAEADAYVQGLEDSAKAGANYWKIEGRET